MEAAKVLIVDTFKNIPLSDHSNTRQAEDLATNVRDTLLTKLRTYLFH